jgi:hypothetical protein
MRGELYWDGEWHPAHAIATTSAHSEAKQMEGDFTKGWRGCMTSSIPARHAQPNYNAFPGADEEG